MVNFDEILSNLHSGGGINLEQEETGDGTFYKDVIWIDDKRNFVLPVDFNPTIAYEGDVNSKIILFELPKEHYGHALEDCDNKKLKWTNTNSGAEGTSTLIVLADGQHEGVVYKWEVPAEAFTRSGDIQIAIVFYDEDEQGLTAFSWNTAKFSGLNVGETVNYIGVGSFPAKDEILIINTDTKNITAPSGYNNTIENRLLKNYMD